MATAVEQTGAESVAWDLSPLYGGMDDPAYARDREAAVAAARAFRERYAGRLGELDAAALAEATAELERIRALVTRVGWFAQLQLHAEATEERSAEVQRAQELETAVATELLFFDLEWAALPDDHVESVLQDPAVERYRRTLQLRRRFRPHQLSEPEERIAAEKAATGLDAWLRLYMELLSRLRVQLPDGEVPLMQATSRLETLTDRDERRETSRAIGEGLAGELRTRAFVFNTVLNDRALEDRLRGFPTWISAFNLTHQISDEAVDALVESVTSRYEIARRHYRLRARLLGLDKIATYDMYAPTLDDAATTTWEEARSIVLDAYESFSDVARDIVARFFDERWIDAAVRPSKMPGAYCTFVLPDAPPYILMSFTGSRRSVLTLAHELGHGIHGILSKPHGFLNALDVPLTLHETASVFGESLTYDLLRARAQDDRERLDLLVSQIDTFVRTAFRPIAGNRFEHAVHTARRSDGELTADRISELWSGALRDLFGDAVDSPEEESTWWSYYPHFVFSPGYMYPYSFGLLLSFSIYRRWREERDALVEPILDVLRAGSSEPPEQLIGRLGFDLRDPQFWHRGLDAIEELVGEAESLADAR